VCWEGLKVASTGARPVACSGPSGGEITRLQKIRNPNKRRSMLSELTRREL